MDTVEPKSAVSLVGIVRRFKWRVGFTFALVVAEYSMGLLFPLFLGAAIDDLLEGRNDGLIHLVALGAAALFLGSARRFYDTRIYSGIYARLAPERATMELGQDKTISAVTARASLLTELVEFLENSFPLALGGIISLVGVLSIVAGLNSQVFYGCLALLGLVVAVYTLTGKTNYRLNAGYNDRLERQVSALETRDAPTIQSHFRAIARWNVRLSDLETLNYFAIWCGVIALLALTPVVLVGAEGVSYGRVLAVMMYVFDYIEALVGLPLYVQQLIRLTEISSRLSGDVVAGANAP